jgi:hypothetical protein
MGIVTIAAIYFRQTIGHILVVSEGHNKLQPYHIRSTNRSHFLGIS